VLHSVKINNFLFIFGWYIPSIMEKKNNTRHFGKKQDAVCKSMSILFSYAPWVLSIYNKRMCPYTKNLCEDNPNFTPSCVGHWRGAKKKTFQVGLVKSVWSFRVCYTSLLNFLLMKPCQPLQERTHPRKGEKKKQGTWIKVEASKQPKRGRTTRWKGKHSVPPKTSTTHMKHIN
jgi:hypothetical protein